ncbi:MAG: hypothetical protein LBR12_00595, partial [Opitutaceae bacterium]|nr:hypothetical protein [Opitutaceae bacterium]
MPVHHYVPLNPPCKLCGDGFDSLQPPHAPPLHECPRCGRPVARQPAAPSLPRLTA